MEDYRTIRGTAIGEYEEKKSRFIAQLSFADSEEAAVAFLEKVRAENRTAPCWNFLRGKCHMAMEEFPDAAKCFLAAEGEYNVLRELEICYREMGDYKNAYIYVCRQKDAQ